MRILVIHGPNLNLLGEREPEIYGSFSLDDINKKLKKIAKENKIEITIIQSNHEGDIVDVIGNARDITDAIIINPTSVDVPIEVPIVYAVITALIHKTNKENASNIITFIERLDNESQFFYFISIRDKFPEVIANAKYIEWMNKNKEYLM